MADSDVQVRFGASIDGLLAGVEQSKEAMDGLSSYVSGIGDSFKEFAEVIGVSFAIDKIVEFENRFAELGEQINRTSKITGVSTGDVQAFSLAVKMAGGDSETAGMTLNILQKNIGAAISVAGPARTAFENMGFSLAQLKNTDVVTLLFQIKQRMDEAGTSAEQSALKQEYLRAVAGRSAAQFLALGLSLEQVKKLAEETGSTMSPQMVGQAKELADKNHELSAAWTGLSNTIGSKVTPAYEGFIGVMTRLIEKTNELASANDNLAATDKPYDPTGMLKNYEPPPKAPGLQQFEYGPQGMPLGEGQFGPQKPAPLPLLDTTKDASDKDTRDQAAREATNTQIELSKLAFAQIAQDQDALVAQFKETEAQKIEALKAAAELQVQTEQSLLDQEAAGYAKDSLAYQQVQDKKAVLAAQFNLEVSKLNEQLAAAQKKQYEQELAPWKQLMGDMGGAFDTMINGILSGQQTWKQALAKSYDDLLIKFTEVMAKMTAEYAVFKATQTGASTASGILGFGETNPFAALGGAAGAAGGGAANAATQALTSAITGNTASTVGNTGGILQQIQSGLQWIAQTLGLTTATTTQVAAATADASATTASATATTGLIPTIVANTAALAANTTALFTSKAIPSYDVGSWSIPSDQVAMVHAGEMIIPAQQAGQIRSGAASIGGGGGAAGGGVVSITVNALDSKSAMAAINNPSFMRQLAKNIGAYQASNPSIRPGY